MNQRRRASRGFTLVEALIASSLMAMLAIMTLVSMRTGFKMWDRSGTASAAIEEVAFAQGFLRRSIEGAYPRLVLARAGSVDFSGTAASLDFAGPSLSSVSFAGRARIQFSVVDDGDSKDLIVEMRPDIARETAIDMKEVLFRGARDIRFFYLDADSKEWVEEWRERPGLPALVRVEAALFENDRRRWPTLVMRPLVNADVDCRHDALTYGCVGRRR